MTPKLAFGRKDSQDNALERLEALELEARGVTSALERANKRLDEIEHQLRLAGLDWSELYDKTQKALGRITARQRRDRTDSNGAADAPVPQGPPSAAELSQLISDGKLDVHNLHSVGLK